MPPPTIHVQIDEPFAAFVPEARLDQVVRATLQHLAVAAGELTVVVTDDEALRALNYRFRGVDAATDVLSFGGPAEGPEDFPAPGSDERPYLGDVVIAYPSAERQARAQGHSALEEVLLLAVHGTLHLMGYDHSTAAEKARMWAAQAAILAGHPANRGRMMPNDDQQ
ncbi:MAG: rRNA maturation RNase YbeY [Anaerolineae bacterium]